MADNTFRFHLERLRSATVDAFSVRTIPEWIVKNTRLNGTPFSFKDHEYQEMIARDDSQEVIVRKCAQVGISELSARISLALASVIPGYTVIYTLPTAKFAAIFMRTRIDPVIQGSEYLSQAVHKTTDNADVKRLGDSYIYVKGSQSSNAPLSIPADHLVHDEIDASDQELLSVYQSRLTHSKYKRKTKLSTPTLPKFGIDYEFQQSRRHFNMVKCNHCNHWFVPDYYKHVKVKGSKVDLRDINKYNLYTIDYKSAYVECPACGRKPSLQPRHREWVCENASENFVAAGYQVSPFDAPNIITPGYLIEASTQYRKRSDFDNQNLGIPAEDKDATLTQEELEACLVGTVDAGWGYGCVMGLDMGLMCHCVISSPASDGRLRVVHTEIIPLGDVQRRRRELAREYRVRITVVDSLPYTETVIRMQDEDRNLFGAFYVESKSLETHVVKDRGEDEQRGVLEVRQVNINRNKAFDALMGDVRAGVVSKVRDANDAVWVGHLQDMKRVKGYDQDNEIKYVWRKSHNGDDHFHHATLYSWVAAHMLGVAKPMILMPTGVMTFKVHD